MIFAVCCSHFPLLQNVSHKLGLQFLRTAFAANMDCAFLHRKTFVPRCKMHFRDIVFANRAPHDPPAVTRSFLHSAVRPRTTQKFTRNDNYVLGHVFRFALAGLLRLRQILRPTCHLCKPRMGHRQVDLQTLFVKQVFSPHLDKFIKPLLPLLSDASRIFPRPDGFQNRSVYQEVRHLF